MNQLEITKVVARSSAYPLSLPSPDQPCPPCLAQADPPLIFHSTVSE